MIKFLVSDMDGTLFEGHGETVFDLTARNEEGLEKIKRSEIEFCVASGRMIGFGIHLMEKYQFDKVRAAGFNGAVCYDQGKFVSTCPMEKEMIRSIYAMMEKKFPDYEVIQVQGLNSERIFTSLEHPIRAKYSKDIAKIGIGQLVDFTIHEFLDDVKGQETIAGKMSITMNTKERCLEVIEEVKKIVNNQCFVAMSMKNLIEIGNITASKGVFIEYLKEAYHLKSEEIAVIGDANNDAEMYPLAGHRFAMANGTEEIKELADYVVQDVAECIEICLKLNEDERNRTN